MNVGAVDNSDIEIDRLMGNYSSVTESDCNIRLQLLEHGKAKIVQACRLEDGSHKDAIEETNAAWSFDRESVAVKYDGVTDTFIFRLSIPYADFGGQGAGPGLERVGVPHSKSKLSGYGKIWKKPIESFSAGQ